MSLTGDFGKLARWTGKIKRLDATLAFEIADQMSDAALGLVAEGFARQSDPSGRSWAPKKRDNGRPILRGKTDRLVKWRKVFVNQHGYRIATNAPYGKYHQRGTRRMIARRMAPTGNPLPAKWSAQFRGVFVRRMHSLLTK